MEDALFIPKVRLLKAEGTLLYGPTRVTWTLCRGHFAELRTALHKLLLRIIGFQHRQRTDHPMSCAKSLEEAQCESVETTIRERPSLCGGCTADDQ